MIVLEILATVLMLACLARAAGYARRRDRELFLPIGIYLTVAVMLGFAAFGGESTLLEDPARTLEVTAWLAGIAGVVGGYALILRTARKRAAERHGGGG